jgi:hypothetical protein
MKAALAHMVTDSIPGSPVSFRQMLIEETEKWAKVDKLSGAKAETDPGEARRRVPVNRIDGLSSEDGRLTPMTGSV